MDVYLLDLLGVFAFAFYGAYVALKKDLDIFGITVCATLTALGGGTIREIILNHTPFYFHDYNYFYVIFLGMIFSTLTYKSFPLIDKYMLIIDAVGLATFAFIGSQKAVDAHLGLVGVIFFAVITAVGGGMLRDIAINELPKVLYQDFYAQLCIILAIFYYIFKENMNTVFAGYSLLLFIFAARVFVIYHKLHVWTPSRRFERISHLVWLRESSYNPIPTVSLFLAIIVAFVCDRIMPVAKIIHYPFSITGFVFIGVGIFFAFYSLHLLEMHNTTIDPGGTPAKLVKTGTYKISRNPIYLGHLLIILGISIFLGSLSAFFGVVLYFFVVHTIVVSFEERKLKKAFGKKYTQYQKSVRRWL